MKKKIVGIILCIIFLLVLMSIPSVNADTIKYPKEEGPYFVFIGGKNVGGMGASGSVDHRNHTFPFWDLPYEQHIKYDYGLFSIFFVNGKIQNINSMRFPADIRIQGFRGFAPTYSMIQMKFFIGRVRVFGVCDEIFVFEEELDI